MIKKIIYSAFKVQHIGIEPEGKKWIWRDFFRAEGFDYGCGKTGRPGLCGGLGSRHSYREMRFK